MWATVLAQKRRCFLIAAPEEAEMGGIRRCSSGELGLFISHASDKYGLVTTCFSSSFWSPGSMFFIYGVISSVLNLKPRSMNPFSSSFSSSEKLFAFAILLLGCLFTHGDDWQDLVSLAVCGNWGWCSRTTSVVGEGDFSCSLHGCHEHQPRKITG